ncbi:MAG: hypothetical protein AAF871_02925 [Pseudomonadota bacterium]
MTKTVDDLIAQLTRAIERPELPKELIPAAKERLERLSRPVRIAVAGLPKSGKSRVGELLVGESLTREGITFPSMRVQYGKGSRVALTLEDGSVLRYDTTDPLLIKSKAPVFIDLWANLPALKKITLYEVSAGTSMRFQREAMLTAAEECDLMIYCTQVFGEDEQEAWSAMPTAIKRHAVLLRTKADEAEDLELQMRAVEINGDSEFGDFLPLATLEALAAREAKDKAAMQASGGSALISHIKKVVSHSRRHAEDQASLFVKEHLDGPDAEESAPERPQRRPTKSRIRSRPVLVSNSEPEPPAPPAEKVLTVEEDPRQIEDAVPVPAMKKPVKRVRSRNTPSTPLPADDGPPVDVRAAMLRSPSVIVETKAAPKSEPLAAPEPAAAPEPNPEPQPEAEPDPVSWIEPAPEPIAARKTEELPEAAPEPVEAPVEEPADGPLEDPKDRLQSVVERLCDEAKVLQAENPPTPQKVVASVLKTVEWLQDYLQDTTFDGPEFEALRERATVAHEYAILISIENDSAAAVDGVSLLLQLRRSCQAALAA